MLCTYENDTRIYKIQTVCSQQVINSAACNRESSAVVFKLFEISSTRTTTLKQYTHTHNITFPWHISAWCSSVRRSAGILQRPCMFQTCYHHHLYLFYRETPVEIQWTGISFVSPSITHFLPCLYHFRALIWFPRFSVKTLNQFTSLSFIWCSCENRAATFTSTCKLQASMHTQNLLIYNLTCFGPHTYVNLHTHTHMHKYTLLVTYFIVLVTTQPSH